MKSTYFFAAFAALISPANAYWLMGMNDILVVERLDPIVNPGSLSAHVHAVIGGSNFGMNITTSKLRQSECTSSPIPADKSNYWFPLLYFQWANGSFTSVNGGVVVYYLFSDTPGKTTAFPDDFRMISGTPTLRTYSPTSFAQQAVTFLCLDFNGVSTRHTSLPAQQCPSGVRAQINFPSCWDGKNVDSADHKSHVAFLSEGADKGSCLDPKYPITLPRIFMEVYLDTHSFSQFASQAMRPDQPFVYSNGDPTGYGYHADFANGWDQGALQRAVDGCNCNPYGSTDCCVEKGIFEITHDNCYITNAVDEQTLGTLDKLPGNNPVQMGPSAIAYPATSIPPLLSPVYVYTSQGQAHPTGTIVVPGHTVATTPIAAIPTSNSVKTVQPTTLKTTAAVTTISYSAAAPATTASNNSGVHSPALPASGATTTEAATGSNPSPTNGGAPPAGSPATTKSAATEEPWPTTPNNGDIAQNPAPPASSPATTKATATEEPWPTTHNSGGVAQNPAPPASSPATSKAATTEDPWPATPNNGDGAQIPAPPIGGTTTTKAANSWYTSSVPGGGLNYPSGGSSIPSKPPKRCKKKSASSTSPSSHYRRSGGYRSFTF